MHTSNRHIQMSPGSSLGHLILRSINLYDLVSNHHRDEPGLILDNSIKEDTKDDT